VHRDRYFNGAEGASTLKPARAVLVIIAPEQARLPVFALVVKIEAPGIHSAIPTARDELLETVSVGRRVVVFVFDVHLGNSFLRHSAVRELYRAERFSPYGSTIDVDEDAQWHSMPEEALPGQFRIGDFVTVEEGKIVRIVGRSTIMLKVRPIRWWERLFRFVKSEEVERTK